MSECAPGYETTRALLELAAHTTGCAVALVAPAGPVLACGGEASTCDACPGLLDGGCRLLAAGAACRATPGFVAVPVPGAADDAMTLIAMPPPDPAGPDEPGRTSSLADFLTRLADVVAVQASERAENELMSLELSTRYEELNLIYGVAQRLAHGGRLADILHYILEESMSTTSGEWALLHLDKRNILEVGGWAGDPRDGSATEKRQLRMLSSAILEEVKQGADEPLLAPGRSRSELEALLGTPAALIAVPIRMNGEVEGFLAVAHLAADAEFSTSDVRLLQALAEQVALVVSNWELHASLREFLMSTVRSLVSAIDAKDSYTRGHSERVHQICLVLGRRMGLSAGEFEALRWASLLHDIGKLGVPEAILTKPGKLTDREFEIMRRHPLRSVEIISHIAQLAPALDGIRHHHERWNGTGYPARIAGERIPLVARIISVADTFDALTSARAYRGALPPEEVREYIRQCAGHHLDPRVVEVFDRSFPELLALIDDKPESRTRRPTEESHERDTDAERTAYTGHGIATTG